jgi:hypothetical protein
MLSVSMNPTSDMAILSSNLHVVGRGKKIYVYKAMYKIEK